jgi:hypothetical protein
LDLASERHAAMNDIETCSARSQHGLAAPAWGYPGTQTLIGHKCTWVLEDIFASWIFLHFVFFDCCRKRLDLCAAQYSVQVYLMRRSEAADSHD